MNIKPKKIIWMICMVPFKWLAISILYAYKVLISPLLPAACRFHPTCSTYSLDAIQQHGLVHGIILTIKRLGRCQPWHAQQSCFDPVPCKHLKETSHE